MLMQVNPKELVKVNEHNQEQQEVIENFLDHRKEFYVHQVSVCPKKLVQTSKDMSVFDEFTFIF
jgi:hypothetical protein